MKHQKRVRNRKNLKDRNSGKTLFKHYSRAVSECEAEIANTRENIKKQEKQEKEYNQSKSDCFKQKDDNSLQIGKCQAKISNYDVIEEQFNKKYEEKLCRNILGVYETGTLELRDDEYKKK